MAENKGTLVTVVGGSGFVGTMLVQRLARAGCRVRVAVRRPDLAGEVRMFGSVGQIQPVQANVRYPESIARAVAGSDVVVNLCAIGNEWGKQMLDSVNVDGARAVAEAARAAGVRRLVHMSALGADTEAPSRFLRSKAAGEDVVREAYPEALIVRPSIIFGPGDEFFNKIGLLSRLMPVLPVIHGKARMQPVHVGDVADALCAAALGAGEPGTVYELGGPEVETVKQLYQRVLAEAARSNPLVPLPARLARFGAALIGWLPNPLLTADQVSSLSVDNVVSDAAASEGRTLAAFGIDAEPMAAILPTYLWRFRKHGQYDSAKRNGAATA